MTNFSSYRIPRCDPNSRQVYRVIKFPNFLLTWVVSQLLFSSNVFSRKALFSPRSPSIITRLTPLSCHKNAGTSLSGENAKFSGMALFCRDVGSAFYILTNERRKSVSSNRSKKGTETRNIVVRQHWS